MIKRDGVELLNKRTKNVSIARENIDICKKGQYVSPSGNVVDLTEELAYAKQNTVYYPEGSPDEVSMSGTSFVPTIEVVNETSTSAARRLAALGKQDIAALNFASASCPGGGFLAGALAQEEDLCRKSGLYPCTKSKPFFYNNNILNDTIFYTDGAIYSPKVPFFRDEYNLFLEETYSLSIITAPAPNISSASLEDVEPFLAKVFTRRAEKVLQLAMMHSHRTIILGAWGCGAFGNDPKLVANAFKNALAKYPAFEHVCFAVYDTRTPPRLFETFSEVFK